MTKQGSSRWQRTIREAALWRVDAVPSLLGIALVIGLRLLGTLQPLEWLALDYSLRVRPPEPLDDQILIIGIDETDIQQAGTYPIPDRDIATLLKALQRHRPSVIGLDLYRDLPVEPGHADLVNVFHQFNNVIGIENVLGDRNGSTIKPPLGLPPEQVGFADALLDRDGNLRRSLLGLSKTKGDYKFSLTIQLAAAYLAQRGFQLENGIRDPIAMRFGQTELPRFLPDTGGYVKADASGNQILLYPRSGQTPFRLVSMRTMMAGQVPDAWIRDRIVLIGVTASSARDIINSASVSGVNPGLVYGVEIQAHAISQIIHAVLDGRPLLQGLSDTWEYIWILGWGLVSIALGQTVVSSLKTLLGFGIVCGVLVGMCYGFLLLGWWLPLVPALLIVALNGTGRVTSLFYRYQQDLKSKLQDRQFVIDHTFNTIHNGPLQTLAQILKTVQQKSVLPEELYPDLERLNRELRAVYEAVRQETLAESDHLWISSDLELDLKQPTHDLLREVYSYTLTRDFDCFKTLKLKMITFEEMDTRLLTIDQKRGLCRFLEEALCNIGKHATGVTRMDIICKQEEGRNIIRVIDNGIGMDSISDASHSEGRGTRQARELAQQLNGTFQRLPVQHSSLASTFHQGTLCELSWPIQRTVLGLFNSLYRACTSHINAGLNRRMR
jgi:CHASE2 domain-containing sensor protein